HAPRFAFPGRRFFPWTTNRSHIGEPRKFGRGVFEFLAIAELPRTARRVDHVQVVAAVKLLFAPVFAECSNVADKRRYPRDGAEQQMILPSALGIESEATLRNLAHRQFRA